MGALLRLAGVWETHEDDVDDEECEGEDLKSVRRHEGTEEWEAARRRRLLRLATALNIAALVLNELPKRLGTVGRAALGQAAPIISCRGLRRLGHPACLLVELLLGRLSRLGAHELVKDHAEEEVDHEEAADEDADDKVDPRPRRECLHDVVHGLRPRVKGDHLGDSHRAVHHRVKVIQCRRLREVDARRAWHAHRRAWVRVERVAKRGRLEVDAAPAAAAAAAAAAALELPTTTARPAHVANSSRELSPMRLLLLTHGLVVLGGHLIGVWARVAWPYVDGEGMGGGGEGLHILHRHRLTSECGHDRYVRARGGVVAKEPLGLLGGRGAVGRVRRGPGRRRVQNLLGLGCAGPFEGPSGQHRRRLQAARAPAQRVRLADEPRAVVAVRVGVGVSSARVDAGLGHVVIVSVVRVVKPRGVLALVAFDQRAEAARRGLTGGGMQHAALARGERHAVEKVRVRAAERAPVLLHRSIDAVIMKGSGEHALSQYSKDDHHETQDHHHGAELSDGLEHRAHEHRHPRHVLQRAQRPQRAHCTQAGEVASAWEYVRDPRHADDHKVEDAPAVAQVGVLVAHEAEGHDLRHHLHREDQQQRQLGAFDELLLKRAGRVYRRVPRELQAVEDDDAHDERLKERVLHQLDRQVAREGVWPHAQERCRVVDVARRPAQDPGRWDLVERVHLWNVAWRRQLVVVHRATGDARVGGWEEGRGAAKSCWWESLAGPKIACWQMLFHPGSTHLSGPSLMKTILKVVPAWPHK